MTRQSVMGKSKVVGAGFDQKFSLKVVNLFAKPARTKVKTNNHQLPITNYQLPT
ncbi:hypothetical protein H6G17_03740 [Chroococcidiopsis sp. FACHB-1243]|uniref:hypothetical protein n=1 Tax=Chroococcidiopsis sp. [FACHB-1243] TaxID=2692781 RepID=UPI0017841015|nr:hypothetical protein [Chroococcidiopsis sp. [FACHB-1243]]MBD2304631.1 hypothetical protein [Chroococcidiopsis sp. [FACHB-1243]]